MDELIKLMVTNAPNLVGLIVAVVILDRIINRLLDDVGDRIDRLENRIDNLDKRLP